MFPWFTRDIIQTNMDFKPLTAHNLAAKVPTEVIIVPSESSGQSLSNGMGPDGIGSQKR